MKFGAPDDGRKNRLKHVERLTERNKIQKRCNFWLYSENILAMHGPMHGKFTFLSNIDPVQRHSSLFDISSI